MTYSVSDILILFGCGMGFLLLIILGHRVSHDGDFGGDDDQ